jgi:hypothetical protein
MKKNIRCWLWGVCLSFFSLLPVQAQETYGRSEAPLLAEVLDMQIRTSNPDEMAYVIKQVLVRQYIEGNKLQATDAELAEFLQRKQLLMENNRIKLDTRRDEIRQTLTEGSLTAEARAQLQQERVALQEMDKAMAQAESRAGTAESDAAETLVAQSFIEQWKVNRALYHQYGGRVIYQQGGAEPLDAWQQFLRDAQQAGQFRILQQEMEPALWSYYTKDSIHRFYPDGAASREQAINTPWWMLDEPAE